MSLRFVPQCSFHDKSSLVSKMAWRRLGDKPLSKPMMTKFIDAYMRHSALRPIDAYMYMGRKSNPHCFRYWLVAWSAPCHYQINAGILLIGPLETNFSEILIGSQTFSFKKMHLKMSAILSLPQCVKRKDILLIDRKSHKILYRQDRGFKSSCGWLHNSTVHPSLSERLNDAYMHQYIRPPLVQIMACYLRSVPSHYLN